MKVCPQLNPKLRTDTFLLAGKEYGIHNISSIPVKELHPHHVFTREEKGVTAFFSYQSPLSNFYNCKIVENGKNFHSSEQLFMYKKALKFNDHSTAEQILLCKSPEEAKGLGRKVQGFKLDIWRPVASDLMFDAMYQKFSQNQELRSFLLQTCGTTLAEANPTDRVWGTGISLKNDHIFSPDKWTGKNMAGEVLARVRQTLQ